MAKKAIPLYKQKPTPPLGEWLRQLRQAKDLALREVAAAAEMDQAHLSKAELGQRLPTTDQCAKLAKFFKVDATLMEAKRVAEKCMADIAASPAGQHALNILREVPPQLPKSGTRKSKKP
jgi:HTH-type transcriptional regulator, competence development regulator